jgi:hypothetical protein
MQHVNRRHLLKLAGIGTVMAAGIGVPAVVQQRDERQAQLQFRSELGLPEAPLPTYATYLLEGTVDLAAGTGLVVSRVLAGHPDAQSDIGLPGMGRIMAITRVEERGPQLVLSGLVQDRSQLQPGESPEVELIIDRVQKTVQAPFGRESVLLRLA